MNRRRIILTHLLLLLSVFGLNSQESSILPPEPIASADAGEAGDPDQNAEPDDGNPRESTESLSDQDSPADSEELSFYDKTLIRDIETASYYELLAWCGSLGLSDKGDTDSLRRRLFEFYSLEPSDDKQINQNVSVISVKSASNSDYFTVEETDQQMVVLKGGVEVEMEEQDGDKRRHIIRAEELVFNQARQTITARGDLQYTMISGDREDVFYGDSLQFSVNSWNGLIYKGTSVRVRENDDGEEQTFYFSGDILRKSGSGRIFVMEDGIIKTQDREDPAFHIKSDKLWMLGPKEWGILHGILYVGHVPMFYIPFYFKPGNEMIFNPAVGTKTGYGSFIQTTTYLVGQKEAEEDESLFSLGDSTGRYELVREGLYLMKMDELEGDGKDEDYLKVMADWYSRLGTYSGVEGRFSGKPGRVEFRNGIGVSRSVDEGDNIYFMDDDGEYSSNWHTIYWGDDDYPFRWGNELSFDIFGVKGEIPFYSDPYFNDDFMDREENFDWVSSLMTSEEEDEDDEDDSDEISDMDWTLGYTKTFQPELTAPFLESITVSNLKATLEWDKKTNNEVLSDDSLSPARTFFYPDSFKFPYVQISLKGTPFSYSSRDGWDWGRETEDGEEAEKDELSPPWDRDEEEATEEEAGDRDLKPGEYWSALFQNSSPVFYENSFSYSFTTMMDVEGTTNSDEWDEPEDVDFEMEESYILTTNSLTTTLDNYFWDKRVDLKNVNSYTTNYRTHLNAFGLEEEDVTYAMELSDYQATSVDWDNSLSSHYYPLKFFDAFSASNINYNIKNEIYSKTFESYTEGEDPVFDESWGEWNDEDVTEHKTGAFVQYKPEYFFVSEELSYNLPPLEPRESYTHKAGVDIFHWENKIEQTMYKEEEEWTFEPLKFSSTYTPTEHIKLQQTLDYDFELEEWSKSYSRADLYGFYFAYTHEYTTPYTWDKEEYSWESEEEAFVPSKISTGYDLDFTKMPFWKNRMRFTTDLNIDYTVNLQQFNNNELSFTWAFNYRIHEFMDLKYSMTSGNKNMYLYFEPYRDKLGIEKDYNFFSDLMKSFNIFDSGQKDRYDSHFNVSKIDLALVHHLGEWDLTVGYKGFPKLENSSYEWENELSILLQWNPIPKIMTDIQRSDDEWTVKTKEDK